MLGRHAKGHEIEGTRGVIVLDVLPDPLVNQVIVVDGLVGIHADQQCAALSQKLCERTVAREDVATTSNVKPGTPRSDEPVDHGFVVLIR